MNRKLLSVLTLCLLLLQLTACTGRRSVPVGEIPPPSPPDMDKRKTTILGAYGYAQQNGYKVIHNPAEERRLQGMVDRMARASGAQGFSYPVILLDAGDAVNAAAMNSSIILVYEELLRRVQDDDELATIIGHEVGHIVAKHAEDEGAEGRATAVGVGSQIAGLAAGVGVALAGGGSSAASLASDMTSDVSATVGTGAFVRSYDRDMEREADQIGLMIMAKAGYNPEAALRIWEKAEKIFGAGGGGGSFLSTHPSSSDRLERIQKALPIAQKYYAESRGNAPSVKSEPATVSKKKGKKKKN